MRQAYTDITFNSKTLVLINIINGIISEYVAQDFRLTVRQLYYQLVARGHIENTERSYKRTTGIVNDGRMAGYIDWDAIEDRTREFISRNRWESGKELLNACAKSFHMDMWDNQENRVFVIVEKEALAGVLEGVCFKYDVPLLAARGYPSSTVLREFAINDISEAITRGQRPVVLHLGDHDPSGIDMSRDLEERLSMFADDVNSEMVFSRIALSMKQIRELNPPPNPAKTTDVRFKEYRRKFGNESWELDALPPSYLTDLVETNTLHYIDEDRWAERRNEIKHVRERIADVAKGF